MIPAFPHQCVVNIDAQGLTGTVESGEPVLGNGGALPVDVGKLPVAVDIGVTNQGFHALHIVGDHRHTVVEHMVNGDHGQAGIHQLQHLGIGKIHTGNDHAVHTPVLAVLQIAGLTAYAAVDKGDVIAPGFHLHLQAFQHGGEVFVGQTAVLLVYEQNAHVKGTVGLQRPGGGVGYITHLRGHLMDFFPGFLANIRLIIQRLAHGSHGDAAAPGNVFHGNQ